MINKYDKNFDLIRRIGFKKVPLLDRNKIDFSNLNLNSVIKHGSRHYLITDKNYYYDKKGKNLESIEYQITDILNSDVFYLEYEKDDVVSLYLTRVNVTKEHLSNLPFEINRHTIKNISDFDYYDTTYYYSEKWASRFCKEMDPNNYELLKVIEFEGNNGSYMSFEYWEDDSIQVFISDQVELFEFELIVKG